METIKRTKISDLLGLTTYGAEVNVKGWVRTRRGSKQVAFVALNDGSTIKNVQIVIDLEKIDEELVKKISKKGKKFYGCSDYPNCDFASPGIPTGEKCPECGGYIIYGIRNRKYCMNPECPSRAKKTSNKDNEN